MLAALMLFSTTLLFVSCNSTDANAETTTTLENQETEATAICDKTGHTWGKIIGNPYADSICTVCGYCRHNSGVSVGVYKTIDEKYHAYGDQCYACFELVDPIIEEHTFVDGYCDYCIQEDLDFIPAETTTVSDNKTEVCEHEFPTYQETLNPYADSICVKCGYCRHNSGIVPGIYRIIDEKYHAYGDQCYACFELVDPVVEEHTFVDGYCDYCFQEDPAYNHTTCDHEFPTYQETLNPYADSICVKCGYCRHNSGIVPGIYKIIDEKYHAYGDQCYACFELINPITEEHAFVDGYCNYCFEKEP